MCLKFVLLLVHLSYFPPLAILYNNVCCIFETNITFYKCIQARHSQVVILQTVPLSSFRSHEWLWSIISSNQSNCHAYFNGKTSHNHHMLGQTCFFFNLFVLGLSFDYNTMRFEASHDRFQALVSAQQSQCSPAESPKRGRQQTN